jgi:hypothetical protein
MPEPTLFRFLLLAALAIAVPIEPQVPPPLMLSFHQA